MSAPVEAIQTTVYDERQELVFSQPLVQRGSRSVAFLISALTHCAFFFLLPILATLNFFVDERPQKLFDARVVSLNLRLTEPLYAPMPPRIPRPNRPETSDGSQQGHARHVLEMPELEAADEAAPEAAPVKSAVAPRVFELPVEPQNPREMQHAVLQLPAPTEIIPIEPLPKVASWTDPALPRPKPKPFITPGSKEKLEDRPPDLTAPPVLQASAPGDAVSTINVAPAPSLPRPKLAIPPSRTIPVHIPDAPPELKPGEIATTTGDTANLIILGSARAKDVVVVPPGRNVPPAATRGGENGSGKGVNGVAAGANGGAQTGSGGTGASEASNSRPGPGVAGRTRGISVSGAGSAGAPSKAVNVIALSAGAPPPVRTARAATTALPQPRTFDVVVEQTGADAAVQNFGILKGKPVYTVYLKINNRKAWVMQYCLPPSAAQNAPSRVVTLNTVQTLTPPLPMHTVVSGIETHQQPSYALIHGFVTTAGKFRSLTLLGKVDQQVVRLLQALEQWDFRPAMYANSPAEVEVLLAIPPG